MYHQTLPKAPLALFVFGALLLSAAASAVGAEPETYRLRVENTRYGRIEMSVDGGAHYVLVGRALNPATALAAEKVATTPGSVLRSGKEGVVFAVAPGRVIKLRPRASNPPTSAGRKRGASAWTPPPDTASIVTNLEAGQGIFGEFAPPFRSDARLQAGQDTLAPFPDAYAPTEDDVFVFLVTLPPPAGQEAAQAAEWKQALGQRIAKLGETYAAQAVARARAEKRMVVSGQLTLRAKLPVNEPDPIAAVTYAVDGNVVAAQNTPPFTHTWDTRQVPDGEHVVEIRALNGRGGLLTRALALIVTQNSGKADTPPASPASAPPPNKNPS
ncbi:MAG TPA: Ig-like domain-containing protein [Chthonomonadaceae bacterium]|nr:Ig-like domain-containing protein [Chthonomonadaceae bacterium]